ncbi:substrate-binding domain-containing protein [Murinocardiopsis flavida]|uniref:substrate-binding domain-containing protein n=1 Tax=Murinocardiopsis flavida TaxID=645275 RepID=UPI001FEB2A56|nr:substrate-binding domain-containing protein [Murinocardiopsis flavida]
MACRCPTHDRPRADGDFPVGVVIPLRGPAGIFGPSCEAVVDVAVDLLNAAGGIRGRRVRPVVIDAGRPVGAVASEVAGLVAAGGIEAVTGWHISRVRQHLVPAVGGHVPYVYTSLYEGGEHADGVFCSGETPPDQIAPAMRWMRDELAMRSCHIVGDDYIWPLGTARAVVGYARDLGIDVVGQEFVRLGTQDFDGVLTRVARSGADTVLMLLVGQDAVHFNRAFAARAMHDRVRRLTPLMEENMLLGSGPDAVRELYVAAAYFRSLATESALDLSGAYTRMHGPDAPVLNNMAESCFEGMMALAALADGARDCTIPELMAVSERVGYDSPRGPMRFHSGHARQHVYLAKADGTAFDILARL